METYQASSISLTLFNGIHTSLEQNNDCLSATDEKKGFRSAQSRASLFIVNMPRQIKIYMIHIEYDAIFVCLSRFESTFKLQNKTPMNMTKPFQMKETYT